MARGPPQDDRARYQQRKREIIKQMNEKRQRERQRALKTPKTKEFNLDPTVESIGTKKSRQQIMFERSLAAAKTGDVKKGRRGPDRNGLAVEDRVKENIAPKFETEMRDGESMISFLNRLNREKNEYIKKTAQPLKTMSAKKKAYLKERKAKVAEKKREKEYNRLKDREFEGKPEYIPFGEVAERPPSFDDITMPTNKKAAARSSNLAILNEALARADADVKAKYAVANEEEEEEEESEDAPKRISKEERAKMLADARAKQRKVEVEKARLQAQMAYRELKSRRGNKGMSALAVHSETLRQSAQAAMQNLQSVDRR